MLHEDFCLQAHLHVLVYVSVHADLVSEWQWKKVLRVHCLLWGPGFPLSWWAPPAVSFGRGFPEAWPWRCWSAPETPWLQGTARGARYDRHKNRNVTYASVFFFFLLFLSFWKKSQKDTMMCRNLRATLHSQSLEDKIRTLVCWTTRMPPFQFDKLRLMGTTNPFKRTWASRPKH